MGQHPTHAGKMIMTVFAGIAEFERHLVRERTGAGRDAAKKRGVKFGRPRKMNPDQIQIASQLVCEGRVLARSHAHSTCTKRRYIVCAIGWLGRNLIPNTRNELAIRPTE